MSTELKQGALVLLAIGAAVIVYFAFIDTDDGVDQGGVNKGCTLTAAAAATLATDLRNSRSSPLLIASILGGSALAGDACSSVVTDLVDNPGEPVTVGVEGNATTTLELPPPEPAVDWERVRACYASYPFTVNQPDYQACMEGTLSP